VLLHRGNDHYGQNPPNIPSGFIRSKYIKDPRGGYTSLHNPSNVPKSLLTPIALVEKSPLDPDYRLGRSHRVGSRRWSWLHPMSFAAFAGLLLALLIALIVVDHFANAYDGFEINSSTSPYT
jgi:hypothetical protein